MTAGAPAVLGAAGFTSSGVAGGSLAAAAQVLSGHWMLSLTHVLPVSQPYMRGPPLQEDGLPLAPRQQWAEQGALLPLLPLLPLQVDKPAFLIISLLFAATAG